MMMARIIGFLRTKRKTDSGKKRKMEQISYMPLQIDDNWISFGYIRDGESIQDLQ
jgi:hypothetical protein